MADQSHTAGAASGGASRPATEHETVVMSDKFIGNMTESIGGAYFKLGLVLGVSKTFLERLEINHMKDCWRITFEMLSRWRDTSPHRKNMEAMVKELTTALSRLHLNDVVDLVRYEHTAERIQTLAQPQSGETDVDKSKRAMSVIRLVKECGQPQLWRAVADNFVTSDGQLCLDEAVTPADLPCLQFLLDSGVARDITWLSLDGNDFHGPTSAALSQCLAKAPWLQKLNLSVCRLTTDDMSLVTPVIAPMTGLKWLCLSSNYIDDVGGEAVTRATVNLPRLTLLYLRDNDISETTVARIRDIGGRKPDLYLPVLDLQHPPGEVRVDTLEFYQRYLARLQALTRRLEARAGDWTDDLGELRWREQDAEGDIRRLQS